MKTLDEDTIEIINSVESLLKCLSYRDLENAKVRLALSELRKSSGFKKVIGELSNVHVLNFGNAEAQEGSQRLRKFNSGECVDDPQFVVVDRKFIIQIYRNGKWQDANSEDLIQETQE